MSLINLNQNELGSINEHESESITSEATIKETIKQLGLGELSREEIERVAAKWYLKLNEIEGDYQAGLPSLADCAKKTHLYKKSKSQIKSKDIIVFESKFKGPYLQAEVRGRLLEIERVRESTKKGGYVKAENDLKSQAVNEIKAEWENEKEKLLYSVPYGHKAKFIKSQLKKYDASIELSEKYLNDILKTK
jgi:hypothetical protein